MSLTSEFIDLEETYDGLKVVSVEGPEEFNPYMDSVLRRFPEMSKVRFSVLKRRKTFPKLIDELGRYHFEKYSMVFQSKINHPTDGYFYIVFLQHKDKTSKHYFKEQEVIKYYG